jgi:hypothetical protein
VSNSTAVWVGLGGDPLLVAAIGALIGFGLGVALSYGTFLGRRYLRALGKHKLFLVGTLKRELPNDHLASYDGDKLSFPSLDWGRWDSPSVKVLGHLQDPSYSPILDALTSAQVNFSRHARAMETERVNFESQIDKAIGEPVGMVRFYGYHPGPRPWYALSTIRKVLFDDHRNRLPGGYFDPIELTHQRIRDAPDGLNFQLSLNRTQIAIGDETQMVSLVEKIRPLLDDEFLREYVRRIDTVDKARVGEPTKVEFNNAREGVLERLELKSEKVKGKCELCPSFIGIHPVDEELK